MLHTHFSMLWATFEAFLELPKHVGGKGACCILLTSSHPFSTSGGGSWWMLSFTTPPPGSEQVCGYGNSVPKWFSEQTRDDRWCRLGGTTRNQNPRFYRNKASLDLLKKVERFLSVNVPSLPLALPVIIFSEIRSPTQNVEIQEAPSACWWNQLNEHDLHLKIIHRIEESRVFVFLC